MSEDANRTNPPPAADRLALLFRQVQEHKMVQWAVAYIAVAYAIQHGVILTSESLEWPNAVARATILLLVFGLPLTLVLAWYHGGGVSRHVSRVEFSIIALLLMASSLWFYTFVRPASETKAASALAVQEATVTAAQRAATNPQGAISIAVLPFLDLSPAKDQEYFSDGMTEEITTALAKVADLRVVGRTSAFQFKNNNGDLRAIGQALSATHLIEGSVRKAGNRLRITAQLIKADDGTHIWAEDYDRELTDVFQIQEDIARAITASLRMPLGLKPGENLVNNRSIDPDSYAQFLRARAIFQSRQLAGNPLQAPQMSISLLEQVTSRSPSYAPGWIWLAYSYERIANIHAQSSTESLDESRAAIADLRSKADAAAKRALELDPTDPGVYTLLGLLAWGRGQLVEADAAFQKSLLFNPGAGQMSAYAAHLADAGYIKEALALTEKAHAQDPLDIQTAGVTVFARWFSGDDAGAIALAKTLPPPVGPNFLTGIYASQGHFQEAADALAPTARDADSPVARIVELLRKRPAAIAPESLPADPPGNLLRFTYPALGAWDRILARYERSFDAGSLIDGGFSWVWHPSNAPARRSEQFKRVVRKVGLVDFWRAKGWPPQCHPTTGDDFVCN